VWSIVVEVILFIVTIVLAMLDTAEIPGAFFWMTMISVVIINSKHILLASDEEYCKFITN